MKYSKYLFPALTFLVFALMVLFFPHKGPKKKEAYSVVQLKPFVVVIPSYNNEQFCERNLKSVLSQKYDNFRVIYIDDCSQDGTYEKVKKLIEDAHQESRVTLIRNEKNRGAMENFYRAIMSCKDEEIVVSVDGDDYLAHDWVLEKLNGYYANPDVWITYGRYLYYPSYRFGECSKRLPKKVFNKVTLREYSQQKGLIISHLRTFYAGLFKKIKLQDLLYKSIFFDSSCDAAMMLPMVEMAGKKHTFYAKDILYIYNQTNPISDDKIHFEKQQRSWRHILSLEPYKPLQQLTFIDEKEEYKSDVVVFSYDRPLQLYAYLESLERYVKNVERATVIYRVSRDEFNKGYEEVKKTFPKVAFCKQGQDPKADFKPLVMQTVFPGTSDYVFFAVDDIVIKDHIDISHAIREMKRTSAHGFYLRLGKSIDYCYMMNMEQGIPPLVAVDKDTCAWRFVDGKGDWRYPNSVDMTIYKKSDILPDFKKINFVHPNSMEEEWAKKAKLDEIGLCYQDAKIVNIPLGLVNSSENRNMNCYSTEELLTFFTQGLKIDIDPLFQVQNKSAHIEYRPIFIERKGK